MKTHVAQDIRFRHTRFRAGYAVTEVDAFVEAVKDALRSPSPRLSAGDVAWRRFTPVMLRSGYRMDDVDDYLTEAEHRLGEHELHD